MYRNQEQWIAEYENRKALWMHDGNPRRPHARLTSGKHSNGFFNSRLVIPDEDLLDEAASDLIDLFVQERKGDLSKVQGVIGPQSGATKLSELLSAHISRVCGRGCFSASPAKSEVNGEKAMIFDDKDRALLSDKTVLLCEDVITTGGSVGLAATAASDAGAIIIPVVLVLVNRSGFSYVDKKETIALIDHHLPVWDPERCHLCEKGSEAIPPKGDENWALLNAEY